MPSPGHFPLFQSKSQPSSPGCIVTPVSPSPAAPPLPSAQTIQPSGLFSDWLAFCTHLPQLPTQLDKEASQRRGQLASATPKGLCQATMYWHRHGMWVFSQDCQRSRWYKKKSSKIWLQLWNDHQTKGLRNPTLTSHPAKTVRHH